MYEITRKIKDLGIFDKVKKINSFEFYSTDWTIVHVNRTMPKHIFLTLRFFLVSVFFLSVSLLFFYFCGYNFSLFFKSACNRHYVRCVWAAHSHVIRTYTFSFVFYFYRFFRCKSLNHFNVLKTCLNLFMPVWCMPRRNWFVLIDFFSFVSYENLRQSAAHSA